ncbi:MAG: rod-binding protein [Hyphomicrobiales bacterium]
MSELNTLASPLLPQTTNAPTLNRPDSDDPNYDAKAREQANEFEASFLAALLRPVFEGLAKDNEFGGGFAEETWSGLLTDEYAKSIQSSANLGIADHVYDQLIQLQETTTGEQSATQDATTENDTVDSKE